MLEEKLMTNSADYDSCSDDKLIADALTGNRQSFGILVERYWRMAVALASAKIDNYDAAQDIAQESFLKAYFQLDTLKNRSRFAGWLSKIVLQQCCDHIRKQSRAALAPIDSVSSELLAAAKSNSGLTDQQIRFIRKTVASLPDKLRTVIIMRFIGELNAMQIAMQLNKRHGTIRVWLHRAYKILQKELASLIEEVNV
jgi:RNA polymerase sigma-70 factor, ECF subfamily